MNETTENFWQVWNNLPPWQPPEVFWRLYYDDAGDPLFYSQTQCSGNYIDVTPEQYRLASMQVKVRHGKLIELNKNSVRKLRPSHTGTPCDPQDVAVVVGTDQPHQCWSKHTYEN